MNRQQAKELLPIIQVFAEGKEIEIKTKGGNEWYKLEEDDMQYIDFKKCDLRMKSKYRPFKNKKECWEEMLKHQPFGWIKDASVICNVVSIREDGIITNTNVGNNWYDFENSFNLKFVDGTSFGMKDE